jgi:hypothetical protein
MGDPLIAQVEDVEPTESEGYQERVIGDAQYARDDSDRLSSEREHDEREITDAERLELFRMTLFQSSLPTLPNLPGYHCCWLTTTNPRDSIHGRLMLGYQLLKSVEVPGWEHSSLKTGEYAGCIGINEMVGAKLPLRLYSLYMTEAHHNQPLAEEGKIKATLDQIRNQASGDKGKVLVEDGMAAMGSYTPRKPSFEGLTN